MSLKSLPSQIHQASPSSLLTDKSPSHLPPFSSPPVTILLAVYNGSATISSALTSLYRQTYQKFNVLIVNDGSTDDTGQLLAAWQNKFGQARFKIITNTANQGLTKSLNIGLRHCHSPYIARLDADDIWLPQKLEHQLNILFHHPTIGVIGCWYTNIYPHSTRLFKLPVTDRAIKANIYRLNPFGHSCVIINRRLLLSVGGYNSNVSYSQDRDLWFRLMPLTSFYNLPSVLCHRRVSGGISQTNYQPQMWQSIKIRFHYANLYHASWINYIFLFLPFFIILQPSLVKKLNLSHFLFNQPKVKLSPSHMATKLDLCVINDRPLTPHRGETIARLAMAKAFSKHLRINKVTTINTTPWQTLIIKLPKKPFLLYLRCGAIAAAAISLRHFFSPQIILLEVHNLANTRFSRLTHYLYLLAANRSDLIITIDPLSTQSWLKLGVPPQRILEISSGTQPGLSSTKTAQTNIRQRFCLPNNQALVVYCGNLYRDRGIELILQAAYRLRHQSVHFAIAGGTNADISFYQNYLRQHSPSLNNCTFLGLLPHPTIPSLLSIADLILVTYSTHCPTINTMSPLKFFEALASRRPILAADFPRLRILAPPNGITFYEPDNLTDFTEKIIRHLKATKQDPPPPTRKNKHYLTWSDRSDRILEHVLL